MAGEALTYWDFVKAAFYRRVRLPLLGAMPVNQMALAAIGLLGFVNPGFWFLGAALELAYLGALSSSERFQKLVEGERLVARQRGWEASVQRAFAQLPPTAQLRYQALLGRCARILGITTSAGQTGMLSGLRAGTLNQLLWLFLRLLSSRELILTTLAQVDEGELGADVARLEQRLAGVGEGSPLARSLQATLEIQKKRLENLAAARVNLAVVEAELERIEQQVRLIEEESAVAGGPDVLSARLDAVSSTLLETSRWMDQHAEFFRSLGGEEEVAPMALPRLPELPPAPAATPPPPPRARQKG